MSFGWISRILKLLLSLSSAFLKHLIGSKKFSNECFEGRIDAQQFRPAPQTFVGWQTHRTRTHKQVDWPLWPLQRQAPMVWGWLGGYLFTMVAWRVRRIWGGSRENWGTEAGKVSCRLTCQEKRGEGATQTESGEGDSERGRGKRAESVCWRFKISSPLLLLLSSLFIVPLGPTVGKLWRWREGWWWSCTAES